MFWAKVWNSSHPDLYINLRTKYLQYISHTSSVWIYIYNINISKAFKSSQWVQRECYQPSISARWCFVGFFKPKSKCMALWAGLKSWRITLPKTKGWIPKMMGLGKRNGSLWKWRCLVSMLVGCIESSGHYLTYSQNPIESFYREDFPTTHRWVLPGWSSKNSKTLRWRKFQETKSYLGKGDHGSNKSH